MFVGYFRLYPLVWVEFWIWSWSGSLAMLDLLLFYGMYRLGVSRGNLVFWSYLSTVRGSCDFFLSWVQDSCVLTFSRVRGIATPSNLLLDGLESLAHLLLVGFEALENILSQVQCPDSSFSLGSSLFIALLVRLSPDLVIFWVFGLPWLHFESVDGHDSYGSDLNLI